MTTAAETRQGSPKEWLQVDPISALSQAFELAVANAEHATSWYTSAMKRRGQIARAIRFVALLCFGLGGLIPLAKGFLGAAPASLQWNDLGYVALALGAGLLSFDYFFGISTAYARFVTTEIALKHARVQFLTDWYTLLSTQGSPAPGASLQAFAARLQAFVTTVLGLVERETQQWVAEFRSSLSELAKLGNRPPLGQAAPEAAAGPADLEARGAAARSKGQQAEPKAHATLGAVT